MSSLEDAVKQYHKELVSAGDSPKYILSPDEIGQFVEAVKDTKDNPLTVFNFGKYVTELIKNSYQNGFNTFNLDFSGFMVYEFGNSLKGTQENTLQLSITGNLLNSCAKNNEYVECFVIGSVNSEYAKGSKDSTYFISESAAMKLGHSTINCNFHVGDTGSFTGESSQGSTFLLSGENGVLVGAGSDGSTFYFVENKPMVWGDPSLGRSTYGFNYISKDLHSNTTKSAKVLIQQWKEESQAKFKNGTPLLSETYITTADKTEKFLKNEIDKSYFNNCILTPQEINSLLQEIKEYESEIIFPSHFTQLINDLVIKSYEAGNNNFYLDFSGMNKYSDIGTFFDAEKDNPLKITLKGEFNDFLFYKSNSVHVGVIGYAGNNAFNYCLDSKIFVDGDIGSFGGGVGNIEIAVSGKFKCGINKNSINSIYFLPKATLGDFYSKPKVNVYLGESVLKLREYDELEQLVNLDAFNSQSSNQSSETHESNVRAYNSMVVPITESSRTQKTLFIHETTDLVYTPTNTLVRALSVSPKENTKPEQRRLYIESGSRLGTLGLWRIPDADDEMLELASNKGSYERDDNKGLTTIKLAFNEIVPASYSGNVEDLLKNLPFELYEGGEL